MNSLPPDQRTMLTPTEGGYMREAIPGMEVCDFCSETPVEWAYPCGTVSLGTPLGTSVSSDGWAACGPCHALIEADDRGALAARSATSAGLPELGAVFALVHAAFFDARTGDPQRVTPAL